MSLDPIVGFKEAVADIISAYNGALARIAELTKIIEDQSALIRAVVPGNPGASVGGQPN